jgi:hypothetical protein
MAADEIGCSASGSGNQTASDCNKTVSGALTTSDKLTGGFAESTGSVGTATASGNTAILTGGTFVEISGGLAEFTGTTGSATASNNVVRATDVSRVTGSYGGFDTIITGGDARNTGTGFATANANKVYITGGDVGYLVYGGEARFFLNSNYGSGAADASSNIVEIVDATGLFDVYGGDTDTYGDGEATSNNNQVTLTRSTVTSHGVSGGSAESENVATANNNTVSVTGSTVAGNIISGEVEGKGNASGIANNNKVTVTGSTLLGLGTDSDGDADGGVYGGDAEADGGDATANNNTVTISNSTIADYVEGGSADASNGVGTANDNVVTVENSRIGGSILGGDIDTSASGTATGNTVILIGKVDIAGSLEGGSGDSCTDCLTDNALIIRPDQAVISGGASTGYGITVGGNLQNFASFHFDLPNTIKSGDVIVNVTGAATAAKVGQLDIADGGTALSTGDTLVLVRAAGGLSEAAVPVDGSTVQGRQGALLTHTYRLDVNGTTANDFTATVQGSGASEESKSLVEGVLGATAQVLDGADLVSDQGVSLAVAGASATGGDGGGASFGTTSVGNTRYNTGSHVDTKGWSLIVGASTGIKVAPGTLTLGGFFQYGHGSYDSVNSFTTGKVKGSGDTTSYGIGGLARLDFDSGYFLETSLRVGKVDSDYKGNVGGIRASYDIKAEYHVYGRLPFCKRKSEGKKWCDCIRISDL